MIRTLKTNSTETFYPTSRKKWRQWLEKNHQTKKSVWAICYKQKSNVPSMVWSDAVDEALCFGWIDSLRKSVDENQFIQYFSQRKPFGTWSKVNKDKIKRLTKEGLMAKAGLDCIERAKQNGSWTILDDVERLKVPIELGIEFQKHDEAKKFFDTLSRTNKRILLQWIALARRPETKQNRINEIIREAKRGLKPKAFR